MKKLKFIYLVFALSLTLSCKQKAEILNQNYQIENRNFNFQNKTYNKFSKQIQIIKTDNYKMFVYYGAEEINDTLQIFKNNKIYYRNILLKKIDTKIVKMNNSNLTLNKYLYVDKRNYKNDCNLFINFESGLIFSESLDTGYMTEYDIKKFNTIHKKIALQQLAFKNGDFEVQYAKMDYPELSMMDSIKEGKKWRYFIKKEK